MRTGIAYFHIAITIPMTWYGISIEQTIYHLCSKQCREVGCTEPPRKFYSVPEGCWCLVHDPAIKRLAGRVKYA